MECGTFIIAAYCLIDEWLVAQPRPRQRGPHPALIDSEALISEVLREYLGHDTDTGLYRHFRRHYGA